MRTQEPASLTPEEETQIGVWALGLRETERKRRREGEKGGQRQRREAETEKERADDVRNNKQLELSKGETEEVETHEVRQQEGKGRECTGTLGKQLFLPIHR